MALDKWEAQSHESFVNTDWRFGDLGQKRAPNSKTNAMDAPSIVRQTFPKECAPPASDRDHSSARRVLESAAMSTSYLQSSAAMRAVRRAGQAVSSLSRRVRTQDMLAKTRHGTLNDRLQMTTPWAALGRMTTQRVTIGGMTTPRVAIGRTTTPRVATSRTRPQTTPRH